MFKKRITDIIKRVTHGEIIIEDYETDIRNQGIDSITFISILAAIEEEMGVDFGYGMLDQFPIISVDVLDHTVSALKERKSEIAD